MPTSPSAECRPPPKPPMPLPLLLALGVLSRLFWGRISPPQLSCAFPKNGARIPPVPGQQAVGAQLAGHSGVRDVMAPLDTVAERTGEKQLNLTWLQVDREVVWRRGGSG